MDAVNPKSRDEIRQQFSHQARQMASAPAFHEKGAIERILGALGEVPTARVLDLACGPGIVAEAMATRARQVDAIDATPEMIRLAKVRFEKTQLANVHFLVGSAEQLPFEAALFDGVVTRLSFHHFTDVPAVLAEIRSVLRPGGRLIVADVVSSEDADESALHNSLEKLRDPAHVRMYSAGNLLDIMMYGGYRVMHHESWRQARAFSEWAAIVDDPARTAPLQNVMRALARAGQTAGIELSEESGELRFAHTWLLMIAVAE
jgi:ubiquinone/menaquinone biosynthesis C-methylase UbiE